MRHETLYIDEFLRGGLPAAEAERIAAHLEVCPECRAEAARLKGLARLVESVYAEPPAAVVEALTERLLAIPRTYPRTPERPMRDAGRVVTSTRFGVPAALMPWVRTAAVALFGLLVGYGVGGRAPGRSGSGTAGDLRAGAPSGAYPAAMEGPTGGTTAFAVEMQEMERTVQSAYLGRVEATFMTFVTGASEGTLDPISSDTLQGLLRLTANLKSNARDSDDVRMTRLYGQIESVLMEIERLSTERDLRGAQHVATVIEEQGLLSTLQRIKAGVE